MISIKIGETEHQCLLTIRAAKTYEDLTGKDVGSMQTVSEMGYFIFACVDAAARFNKEKCPITVDDVFDNITFDEMGVIVKKLMPASQGE